MATIGKYCKAYLLKNLRQFSDWTEPQDYLRKEGEVRQNLTDDDILYLQENYVVTDGIFKDENVIFAQVTPEWKEFCTTMLKFEIPTDENN